MRIKQYWGVLFLFLFFTINFSFSYAYVNFQETFNTDLNFFGCSNSTLTKNNFLASNVSQVSDNTWYCLQSKLGTNEVRINFSNGLMNSSTIDSVYSYKCIMSQFNDTYDLTNANLSFSAKSNNGLLLFILNSDFSDGVEFWEGLNCHLGTNKPFLGQFPCTNYGSSINENINIAVSTLGKGTNISQAKNIIICNHFGSSDYFNMDNLTITNGIGVNQLLTNSLPNCNITIPERTCINKSSTISINNYLTCTDNEGDSLKYSSNAMYINDKILEPIYLRDYDYGCDVFEGTRCQDTTPRYEKLYYDLSFINNWANTTYCGVCTDIMCPYIYDYGIKLDLMDNIGFIKLDGSKCDKTYPKYNRVMGWQLSKSFNTGVISYSFGIVNTTESKDQLIKLFMGDSNFNVYTGYYVLRNSTNDNYTIYKYNPSGMVYITEFQASSLPYNYFSLYNLLSINGTDTTRIYTRDMSDTYLLYTYTTPISTNANTMENFKVFANDFTDYNGTFYIGNLNILGKNEYINWSDSIQPLVYSSSGSKQIVVYVSDSVHYTSNEYNTYAKSFYLPYCSDLPTNKSDYIQNDTSVYHLLDLTKGISLGICNSATDVLRITNTGFANAKTPDMCKVWGYIVWFLTLLIGCAIGITIGLILRRPDFILGLFGIFHLILLWFGSFLVDYTKIAIGISVFIFAVCMVSIFYAFITGMNQQGTNGAE